MDYYTPQPNRRHNPVDSICRKLQTIQWRGDLEPNSPFQIPKVSSSSYDSPQRSPRHDVEALLRKGALRRDEAVGGKESVRDRDRGRGMGMPSAAASQRSDLGPCAPLTPAFNSSTQANVTFTVTSTLAERRAGGGTDARQVKTWQRCCSTPARASKESPYFAFTRGPQPAEPESERPGGSPPLSRTFTPNQETLAYSLNFSAADAGNSSESELSYPALVVKRLSMGDGGSSMAPDGRKENMAEISLICEENLLDTIFHACDTQRRGKVYVSHIVDYLRHTTSRSSEDSGLEDLCNMLDPEQKDVSIDLDTYHAVMREWIEDCRNNGEEPTDDVAEDTTKIKESLSAKRSLLLNFTSGSLEAFGGEASRAEFETSELVCCVADLQMSNQKLQEEVRKLKQVAEGMEDSNQRLAEENEALRNQARVNQQLAQKERMLKEEVEEMKATLSCTEEGRARVSAHSKHVERENQSLVAKIASLQEENFKVIMATDDLQRRIAELCDINTELQLQIHSFDAISCEKEALIIEKSRQINELKAAVEEYSSITELLRADKSKLENQLKMMHTDLTGAGLPLSVAYTLNQSTSGSLQTELALAQSPLEAQHGAAHPSSLMSFASPLDETLDKEVLLMLQGPSPEYMAQEFKNLLNKLKKEFTEDSRPVLSAVGGLPGDHAKPQSNADTRLQAVQTVQTVQAVQVELAARRADWALGLDQLAQHADSLERELVKMASDMRRSRTEILHLSVRVQEQENQKRQLCEELEQLKAPQDSREASCQTPAPEEESRDDSDCAEEFTLQDFLRSESAEGNCRGQGRRTDRRPGETADASTDRGEEEEEDGWTAVDTAGEGEARNASIPPATLSGEVQPGHGPAGSGQDSAIHSGSGPEVNCQARQEEASVPTIFHSKDAGIGQAEAVALPELFHIGNNSDAKSPSCSPLTTAETVPASSTSPGSDAISKSTSTQLTSEDHKGEEEREGEVDSSVGAMSSVKGTSHDQSAGRSAAEDSTCPLPVLVEEEESAPDGAAGPASMEGTEQLTGSRATASSGSNSPQSRPSDAGGGQSSGGVASATSDPSRSEDSAAKEESFTLCGKAKKELELSRSVEAIEDLKLEEDQKVQEDHDESSAVTEKESEMPLISDTCDDLSEGNSLSPSDKEVEVEFQRLALGFKCDMFTLQRRLRLEERSRDLAEENVRREVSSCQGLLQALIPLCEDDNQSMEIIQRLQKNLDILIQSMVRVSSRSEMLGAIHQENRIGKAMEVMIQHVENLRRMYTKEHAELLELRETLLQNERSFGSHNERDDFRGKKQPTSPYYKSSARRVSIAVIPRSGAGNALFDMSKTQDCPDAETEGLTRRSPWNVAGKSMARPPLKRFVSSAAWVDTEEPSLTLKGTAYDITGRHSEDKREEEPVAERRRSSLSELGNRLVSLILPHKTPSCSTSLSSTDPGMAQSLSHSRASSQAAAAVARGGKWFWLWLLLVVVLAGLLALLAGLVVKPMVDAAPVGSGYSWMTIQQMLWPYAGLRHNAQPPV